MAQSPFPITTFQFGNTLPVAQGYLQVHLSKDCSLNTTTFGQIAARIKVKVKLNTEGVPDSTVLFWPNSELLPNDSSYIYSVYTQDGQLVLGPQSIIIAPGGGTGGGMAFGQGFGISFAS